MSFNLNSVETFNIPLTSVLIVGVTCATILYGVFCAQVLYYFWHYTNDRLWLKSVVAILWSLDTITTCFGAISLWSNTVSTYQFPLGCFPPNASSPNQECYGYVSPVADTSLSREFFCTTAVIFMVQLYYVHTIWQMKAFRTTKYWILMIIIVILFIMFSCVMGFITALAGSLYGIPGFGWMRGVNPEHSSLFDIEFPPLAQMAFSSCVDVMITVLLWNSMHNHHQAMVFSSTRFKIRKMKQYIIERGTLTALAQIFQITVYLIGYYNIGTVNPFTWIALHLIGSKLYMNSLLALLNARRHIQGIGTEHDYVNANQIVLMEINEHHMNM